MSLLGKVGSAAASAAAAAKRAAEAAAKRAAEAAAKKAAEAAKKAAEAAKKAAEAAAAKAAEQARHAAERGRDAFEGAKDKVGGAVDKARDVVGQAADKVKDVASNTADKAQDVASNTADKAQDVATGAVDKAKDAAGAARDFTSDVFEQGRGVATDAARGVRNAAEAVGQGVSHAANNPGQVLDKATDIAAAGLDKAGEAIQNAPTGSDPLRKISNQVAGAALQGAADVVRDPVETARTVKDAASLNREVDTLRPGEHVQVGLNAEGNLSGVGLQGKGSLAVSRNMPTEDGKDGGYTVSVDGEAGVGLVGKLGSKGAAEVGGSAFLNGGAKVEFSFDTAEEAKRATNIIAKSALTGAAGAANPLAGRAANQVLGDPLEDLAGLKKNVSAVELKLNAEAQGSARLGLDGLENAATGEASAGLNGQLGQTARIEFKEGEPNRMSLKQTWQVGAEGGAQVNLGKQPGQAAGSDGAQDAQQDGVSLPSIGGKGSFQVDFEQSFDLPKDFDAGSLLRDPVGATKQLAQTARATQEGKLTLTDSRQGNLEAFHLKGGGGRDIKLELSGNVQDIANSGAFGSVARGDFGEALRQLEGKVNVQASLQNKATLSSGVSLGGHSGVAGGEVGLSAERSRVGQEQELTARQLVELYQRQFYAAGIAG